MIVFIWICFANDNIIIANETSHDNKPSQSGSSTTDRASFPQFPDLVYEFHIDYFTLEYCTPHILIVNSQFSIIIYTFLIVFCCL